MEEFIASCLQHKRCLLCGKCSSQGGLRYLPTSSLVNLALTLHFRKISCTTTAKICSDGVEDDSGGVGIGIGAGAGDLSSSLPVSIIDHILASSTVALHARNEARIRDEGRIGEDAEGDRVAVDSINASPLQFSILRDAIVEDLSGIVRRLAEQMKSRSHHTDISPLVLMLLKPRAKGCKGGWPVCWKEYTCLPSLSIINSDFNYSCSSDATTSSGSDGSSLHKANDKRSDEIVAKMSPMVIRDEPFDIGYINYDPSRYLADLLAKAAVVRSMLAATLLATGSTYNLDSMSMIKSPLKNFREKCRFSVNHVYSSRYDNSNSFAREDKNRLESVDKMGAEGGEEEANGSKISGRRFSSEQHSEESSGDSDDDFIEFMIWDDNGKPSYVVEEYPIASKLICTILKPLQHQINGKRSLKRELSAIHIMTTLSGSAVIRLLYNERVFDASALEEWRRDASTVVDYLKSCIPGFASSLTSSNRDSNSNSINSNRDSNSNSDGCEVHLTLRSRGCKSSVDSDSVTERFYISNSSVAEYASSIVRFPIQDLNSNGSSSRSSSSSSSSNSNGSSSSSSSSNSNSNSNSTKSSTNSSSDCTTTPFDFSVSYVQSSEGFSNPNAAVNRLCLIWICEVMGKIRRTFREPFDLLEMYCGNGNHSMAIAKSGCVRYVVGVEINNALVEAARLNAKLNGLEEIVEILQSDSSEFTSRLMRRKSFTSQTRTVLAADLESLRNNTGVIGHSNIATFDSSTSSVSGGDGCDIISSSSSSSGGGGDFTNIDASAENKDVLSDSNKIFNKISLSSCQSLESSSSSSSSSSPSPKKVPVTYNFTAILVDPPRCGLDPNTLNLTRNYEHIVYISCNPSSLMRDLTVLLKTHSIERLTCFDQFAYTKDHIETAVHLMKLK